jgi:hypothetical protein
MTTAHNNRAFLAQETLDVWLAEEHVSLDGDVLKLLSDPQQPAFLLTTAMYFQAEVTTGEDPLGLCGTVKTRTKVVELGGEHAPGSVVIGDNAYEVRDGFLGELLPEHGEARDPNHGRKALQALSTFANSVELG